ncbi:MAG TPA: LysM peptidoglycan-binding domain-containing protein [Ohtaekwangia sp.]|uniref:LysM peptidoglycan-binding domain-containing protein n=1 Tax=Ohtaekwangia sp. TaxID=2066019 RepID=UPI002F93E9B5
MMNVLIYAGALFFQPHAQDSLGIETVNGKIFVVHQVGEKETLYAISRRYGTTVDAIVQYNPSASSGLSIGQILKVPYTPKSTNTTSGKSTGGGIIHVVAAKETMFSISKAYGVTVDEIRQWNNLADNSLSVGQEIVIRKRNTANAANTSQATIATPPANNSNNNSGQHVVEAKETLYSIANKYNISVQQLKEWNNLQNDELSIGQSVVVRQPHGQLTQKKDTSVITQQPVNHQTSVSTTQPVKNDTPKNDPPPVESTKTTTQQQQSSSSTIRISESVKNGDEILEKGIAELIEGTDGNRKYLALHRTAPVGTILKVKNELNNREVFVRVMGKLPDTALTDKLIIKISKSAFDRLGAIDPRFRVEVTYYK